MKRVDVACTVIFDETREHVVMVRNKGKADGTSYWSLPGGEVEPGETLEQAARRETKEEAGLEVEVGPLYSVREAFFSAAGHHAIIFTFLARVAGGEMRAEDPDEDIVEVKWMPVAEANELLAKSSVKIVVGADIQEPAYSFHGTV